MGSISYKSSKADAIRGELADRAEWIIKSRVIGSSVWYVGKGKNAEGQPIKFIGLLRIEAEDGLVWVKSLDESMGPYYFNCPVSFFDVADAPTGYAIEWREKVRKFAADSKAKKAAMVVGAKVKYGGINYSLTENLGLKGWEIRNAAGCIYRMKPTQIRDCEVIS